MKVVRLFVMAVVMALLCAPLTGCDEVAENAGTVLKGADVAYNGVMKGSALAYKQGFITKEKLASVTSIAEIYHSSWKAAVTAAEEYDKAAASGDAVQKEAKRVAMDAAVAIVTRRLAELQEYWCEARNAYTDLKDRQDE